MNDVEVELARKYYLIGMESTDTLNKLVEFKDCVTSDETIIMSDD